MIKGKSNIAKFTTEVLLTAVFGSSFVGNMVFNGYEMYQQNKILQSESNEARIVNIITYLQDTNLYKSADFEEIKSHLSAVGFEIKNKTQESQIRNIVNDLLIRNKKKQDAENKQ